MFQFTTFLSRPRSKGDQNILMPHLPQVTLSIDLCSEWYIVFDVVRLVSLTFLMRYFTSVDNDDVVDSDDDGHVGDHIIGAVLVATNNVRGPVASQKV